MVERQPMMHSRRVRNAPGKDPSSREGLGGLAPFEVKAKEPAQMTAASRRRTEATRARLTRVGKVQVERRVGQALRCIGLRSVSVEQAAKYDGADPDRLCRAGLRRH